MGASDWQYIEPWRGGIEETMAALQAKVFEEYFSHEPEDARPADIAELWSGDPEDEGTWAGFMGTTGTHSILDIQVLVPAETRIEDLPPVSTMRPVSAAETIEAFGFDKPTRADFERLSDTGRSSLPEDDGRWTGRCLVLFKDGAPESVAFWGWSGD
jgi:hypothetical protein